MATIRVIIVVSFLALVAACMDGRYPDPGEKTVIIQLVDAECSDEIDYVVRAVYPRSPDSSGITIRLSDSENIEDVELVEFEIHACRTIELEGIFLDFHTYGVSDEEEGAAAEDPQGFLLPDWSERFHNFILSEEGEVVHQLELAHEMSISDVGGSVQFLGMGRRLEVGEHITFTFSSSIRPEFPATSSFVVDVGGLIFDIPPDPNPLDRLVPWGVKITYPQLIALTP